MVQEHVSTEFPAPLQGDISVLLMCALCARMQRSEDNFEELNSGCQGNTANPLPTTPSHCVVMSTWLSSGYYRLINLKSEMLSWRCLDPCQSLTRIPSGTQMWALSPSLPLLQILLFIRLFAHFNWSLTSSLWYTAGIQSPSSWVGTVQSHGCRKARL